MWLLLAVGLWLAQLQACGQRGPLVMPAPAKAASAPSTAASQPALPR
ncbi:MAG: sugar transporter [Ideonella sp. MAG2]|nr:MAG: sugar transporter [Ideonella sp. MAG2]